MIYELQELGWQAHFEEQISFDESELYLLGRVSAHFGSQIQLLTENGELSVDTALLENDDSQRRNTSSGPRYSNIAIGDWYLLDRETHRSVRQLDRKTLIYRKAAGDAVKPQLIAANVDSVFIVSSCNQDFNLSRLERYLALVNQSEATPIVVLTKSDLCDNPIEMRQSVEKLQSGLLVETLDARDPQQAGVLSYWCKTGKTISLLGSSGVGKSTLANSLCGKEILTQSIREDDAKGRHTTTARSMHRLLAGGLLIDNPGMRELQLSDCEEGIRDVFEDVIAVAEDCKFRDCSHQGDAGCAISAAVEAGKLNDRRVKSYLKLLSELSRNSEALFERRDREKKTGRFYKKVISDKNKMKDLR